MNGNTSKDEKKEEKVRSYIHAECTEGGSALFELGIENVSPNQISAFIGYLQAYANVFYTGQITQNLQANRDQQIAVPKPNIKVVKP